MKDIWTNEAKNTFSENIKYLKNRWTDKEVNGFVEKSFSVIDNLLKNPNLGQFDQNWDCHKILIIPQIYLFYEMDNKNIILISFWNNHKKPLS